LPLATFDSQELRRVTTYLFVYGTLMGRTPDRAVNRLLRQQARDVGPAWVCGRLYRLGWYPGLVPGRNPRQRVHGRLLHLRSASRCWPVLDAYEGCGTGASAPGLFTRRLMTVHQPGGRRPCHAWVYVYQGRRPSGRPQSAWRV